MRRVPTDVVRQLPGADLRQAEIRLPGLLQQVQRVRLVQTPPVAVHRVADHLERVARHADHPLHDVQVRRRVLDRPEHHDAVPLGLGVTRHPQEPEAGERDLERAPVDRLIDEQEVPDEQRVFHARRRDTERLDQVRSQHDPDDQGDRNRSVPPLELRPEGADLLAHLRPLPPHPVGDEDVRLVRHRAVPVGRPHQLPAIGREHREGVELGGGRHLLQAGAVERDQV